MQPDRLTIKSQEALAAASGLAQERRNPQVAPIHLLTVLLDDGEAGGVVVPVLKKLGIQLPALRAESSRALEDLPRLGEGSSMEGGQPSAELLAVLRDAEKQARTSRTSTSPPSTCCWRSPRRRAAPARRCAPSAPAGIDCCGRSPR